MRRPASPPRSRLRGRPARENAGLRGDAAVPDFRDRDSAQVEELPVAAGTGMPSPHTVSPSTAVLRSSALRSGTWASISSQLRAGAPVPGRSRRGRSPRCRDPRGSSRRERAIAVGVGGRAPAAPSAPGCRPLGGRLFGDRTGVCSGRSYHASFMVVRRVLVVCLLGMAPLTALRAWAGTRTRQRKRRPATGVDAQTRELPSFRLFSAWLAAFNSADRERYQQFPERSSRGPRW